MSPRPHADVYRLCQRLVAGSLPYTIAQRQVSLFALVCTPPLPVGKVMDLATIAPLVPVICSAVRKKSAAIAGKGDKHLRMVGKDRGTR